MDDYVFIYCYYYKDTPIYVGQTISLCERNYEHKCNDRWWDKNLLIEFICVSKNDADYLEGYYIELFKTYSLSDGGNGYNIQRPGKNKEYKTVFEVNEARRHWSEYKKEVDLDGLIAKDYTKYLNKNELNRYDYREDIYLMVNDICEHIDEYRNTWYK